MYDSTKNVIDNLESQTDLVFNYIVCLVNLFTYWAPILLAIFIIPTWLVSNWYSSRLILFPSFPSILPYVFSDLLLESSELNCKDLEGDLYGRQRHKHFLFVSSDFILPLYLHRLEDYRVGRNRSNRERCGYNSLLRSIFRSTYGKIGKKEEYMT